MFEKGIIRSKKMQAWKSGILAAITSDERLTKSQREIFRFYMNLSKFGARQVDPAVSVIMKKTKTSDGTVKTAMRLLRGDLRYLSLTRLGGQKGKLRDRNRYAVNIPESYGIGPAPAREPLDERIQIIVHMKALSKLGFDPSVLADAATKAAARRGLAQAPNSKSSLRRVIAIEKARKAGI